jgi:hypothetical protein
MSIFKHQVVQNCTVCTDDLPPFKRGDIVKAEMTEIYIPDEKWSNNEKGACKIRYLKNINVINKSLNGIPHDFVIIPDHNLTPKYVIPRGGEEV